MRGSGPQGQRTRLMRFRVHSVIQQLNAAAPWQLALTTASGEAKVEERGGLDLVQLGILTTIPQVVHTSYRSPHVVQHPRSLIMNWTSAAFLPSGRRRTKRNGPISVLPGAISE